MSARRARKEAQRFLDQLREQTQAALGTIPTRADPADVKKVADQFLRESLSLKDAQNPQVRAIAEQQTALALQGADKMFSEMLTKMQDRIEKTAATRIEGLNVAPYRPLIGHLQTGQLNAVSMRVPGRSGAYLVLFEDQMPLFASMFSKAVAWAMPSGPADANDMISLELSVPGVTERIEANPEVADYFADIVVTYAVTGSVGGAVQRMVPPGYLTLASMLRDSLEYFVLGHEYAHILMGHLDTTTTRKAVLPASEAEALAYSWRQELDADTLGLILSLNTYVDQEKGDINIGFSGTSLFFDASDVMDRAVALLETGDENARQLGSHPPSDLRKQQIRDFLPHMAGRDPGSAQWVRDALLMAEVQGEVVRLLWERTRPILLNIRRRGMLAARTWRTIPKETRGPV